MTRLSRNVLTKAFPDNPRLVAEMETLDEFLSGLADDSGSLSDSLDNLKQLIGDGENFQQASALLAAIAGLPNRLGALEVTGDGQVDVRPIDGTDPASLLSRGVAYTLLVGIAGRGPTTSRITVPTNAVAIWFDTTLAANGKPVFWTGVGWVDATGAAV